MASRWHPSECKSCGKTTEDGVTISATGLCPECWERRFTENYSQLRDHNGPWFDHWRRRCLAAFGVVVDTDE